MKLLTALLLLALGTLAQAQQPVPVYLDPTRDSPRIGAVESLSEAAPAEWPTGVDARPGWRALRYSGTFEVYVDNGDLGKDVEPKPGSFYYLRPDKSAARLTTAREGDATEIVSLDSRFCKMRLQTTLVAYAPVPEVEEPRPVVGSPSSSRTAAQQSAPSPQQNGDASPAANSKELVGTFERAGLLLRNRSGFQYKLTNDNGQTLALIDVSMLPDRVMLRDHLGQKVRLSGELQPNENGVAVVLVARNMKLAAE